MDLHPEFLATVADTGEVHRRFLEKVGVKSTAVFRLPGADFGIGKISTSDIGLWEQAEDGRPALILITNICEGEDGPGVVEDLLAFNPKEPGCWWLRRGLATFLGGYEIERRVIGLCLGYKPSAYSQWGYTEKPLRIFRNPLGWLKAGCLGVVVLDWSAARGILAMVPAIQGEDDHHAAEIRSRLREPTPRLPRVTAPPRARAAA